MESSPKHCTGTHIIQDSGIGLDPRYKSNEVIFLTIETDRLALKPYVLDDLENYHQLMSTPLVWKYSTTTTHEDIEQSKQKLEQLIMGYINAIGFHALFDKSTNTFIGEAGILSFNKNANRCVIGYNLLPNFWNRGYATEISRLLINHAFDELRAERVEALAMKSNRASCRVLEKSGMIQEGILRNFTKINGIYYDVCYYGIIASDYKI